MEEYIDESVYLVDLSNIEAIPEIIFELSSILDKDEAKNRRICLKLGNVNLNQAQLLSIKSLINGIGSNLSSIDTTSVDTEKTAISLGIIVSNVLPQNISEVIPQNTYKMAEELTDTIEETTTEEVQPQTPIEESVENTVEDAIKKVDEKIDEIQEIIQNEQIEENLSKQPEYTEQTEQKEDVQQTAQSDEVVQDELDVIFGSDPLNSSIFKTEQTQEIYAPKEELNDIVVDEAEYTKEDIEIESFPTKYIKQTIRSGQVINFEGNIVIIGDCHVGCEITALGDITVWGVLSGIAHAGAAGNERARVRALKMNAIQLRIANCYSRRPDSLNTIYADKTTSFTPEEARIVNGEIVVFKMND